MKQKRIGSPPKSRPGYYFELHGTAGSPVVMIHGFTVRGDMFYPVLPHFEGFSAIVPDLRGCARSHNMPPPYSAQAQADDIVALLDHLGLKRAHIFGYSMGGIIAQQLAVDYPERVKSLVLGCTFAYKAQTAVEMMQQWVIPAGFQLFGADRIANMLGPSVGRFYGIDPKKTESTNELLDWYKRVLSSTPDATTVEVAKALFQFDSRAKLRRIQAPTLVFGAEKDKIVPAYHSEELAKGIPGAELKLYPGQGHGLILAQPDKLGPFVASFMEAHDEA